MGIEAQWASGVSARDATLHAEADPLGVAGEWWLEYGTAPCASGGCARTAPAALPASFGALPLGVALSGLQPATTYHYRFAAADVREVVEGGESVQRAFVVHGAEQTFTTGLGALGFALPDSRAWEMVSPPDKHGGRLVAARKGQIQAAADGDALAYLSWGSVEAEPEGVRTPEESSALGRRGAGGSWSSRDITPPNGAVVPNKGGTGLEYKLFSGDLSKALLEQRGITPLSPHASERTPYLRLNGEPPEYTPLVVACPESGPCPAAVAEYADARPGAEFGGNPKEAEGEITLLGATPDLGRVVVKSCEPLRAKDAEGHLDAEGSLYEWSAAEPPRERLRALSVPPGGGPALAGVPGSGSASVRNALSADGSRLFWSTGHFISKCGASAPGLYVRDAARGETARLDVVQPGGFGFGAEEPVFQGADAAGTVALFTDTQQLSEDSSEAGADLYRCAVTAEEGALGCELADLTGGFEESAEVLGIAPGVSEDGARAYFVARGALDPAPNGEGESASPGQPNLYLWEAGAGIRFIATLGAADAPDWGTEEAEAGKQSAAASPSGRYLAFMSSRPLTGYDNRDASTGQRDQEVFRYDAETGELTCVSCDPTGARPAGRLGEGKDLVDPKGLWDGQPLAGLLPDPSTIDQVATRISLYRPRAIDDSGRVFFNAADALVGADSNGAWDAYEYEPEGVGGCSPAAGGAAVAHAAGGCVALLSSGAATGESAFLDASEDGGDAFFLTTARLSVDDQDNAYDAYDARVDGVAAVLSPLAECLGEACQPAPAPPEAQTPASAAFRGPGDLRRRAHRRCPKGKRKVRRKGRARCVKRHVHRHRHHRHKRRQHGRASR